MIYHTNHCWCNQSHWDGKSWDGEVIVSIDSNVRTDSLSYGTYVPDPDFDSLTTSKEILDVERYDMCITRLRERMEDFTEEFGEGMREGYMKEIYNLKPEVIKWLEENIEDKKTNDVGGNKKGWCVGSDSYRQEGQEVKIFFFRQIDALRFIKEFSIFKSPTFYFDYFNDERAEMDSQKIIDIVNDQLTLDLKLGDMEMEDVNISTDLDPLKFKLLDWELEDDEEGYEADCNLTMEQVKERVEKYLL